jgi:hypothetical protein
VQTTLGLETDNLTYGICGHAQFTFKDANGRVLGTAKTESKCIPSKSPGKARIVNFPKGTVKIDPANAAKIVKIETAVSCDRHPFGIFGINMDPIKISASWNF